jgi:excinuclease ABC subunit A
LDRITVDQSIIKSEDAIKQLESRLRQTVDQALELADGQVILSMIADASLEFPESPKEMTDHLFSQNLACPICNISMPDIEPRLFSFNTPHGACPTCTGLGSLLKIDPEKLIAPELTISEGAIIPLASAISTGSWYANQLKTVLLENGASITIPFKDLSEKVKNIILYGDDSRVYETEGTNQQGSFRRYKFTYEGVVTNLERRYSDTKSDFMRGELERYMRKELCLTCNGTRLKKESLSITVQGKNIIDVVSMAVYDTSHWFENVSLIINDTKNPLFTPSEKTIAYHIVKEIKQRLDFLVSVGLEYLTLSRESGTLAGGEAQRIRLASQIGTGLTGVLYVLDEPTIGLHPRDNDRLISTMKNLRDLGNSLIVVEHDKSVMMASDYLFDFGPKAGEHGGNIVAEGVPRDICNNPNSLTGKYLSGKTVINAKSLEKQKKSLGLESQYIPPKLSAPDLILEGAKEHNLKNVSVKFPLGKLTVVTGVSGSGKSTLIHDTLYPALKYGLGLLTKRPDNYEKLIGSDEVTHVKLIDQSPIGRTPRSNPATYTKVFDLIRELMSTTQEAKLKGYTPGRFSFNVKGGRCEACHGDGQVKISMQFLADVYVDCDVCKGLRYNIETLGIKFKDKNIAEILALTVDQALEMFKNHHQIMRKLKTMQAVGLGYIKLGQSAPTLSGGEAQRVKLAKELSVVSPGHTVYLLDEPTTGLHFEDVKHLLIVLKELISANNTVIIIEHNLDVIANADWIIDLGPEGGNGGGAIVATGSPEEIQRVKASYTGLYLSKDLLDQR